MQYLGGDQLCSESDMIVPIFLGKAVEAQTLDLGDSICMDPVIESEWVTPTVYLYHASC